VRRFLPILIAALALLACNRKPSTPPDVIVRVGERMVTVADFKNYIEHNAGTDLAQVTPEVASAMLDQYIEEILLSEYAASHGIEVPAEKIASAVRTEAGSTVIEKRDEMRRQKLLADLLADVPTPADADVRAYYEQHPTDFRRGEELHIKQILVHDEALANDIEEKLKNGASFEELSSQHSLAPNAKKGGEIGYVSRGELPKMFEDEIFALKPGGVSPVIRTESSYHIFKVDDRRAPGVVDIQMAAPAIQKRMKDDALRERIAETVKKARGELTVAVLTRRLPFRYSGTLPKNENE
jgi:peptidyl-prolyl cis-trans isomerase C